MSTAVPPYLMPHTATLVRPSVGRDAYGSDTYDYADAERTEVRCWLQQDTRREVTGAAQDGRRTQDQRWLMVTGHPDVRALDRVEWTGPTEPLAFEVDGPPAPTYSPWAHLHHTEVPLRVITG